MEKCCKFIHSCLKWAGGFLSAVAWCKFEVMTKWRNKLTQLTPVICIYDMELAGVIERGRERQQRGREEGNEGDAPASFHAQPLFTQLSNDGYFCFHRVWKLNWYLWEFLYFFPPRLFRLLNLQPIMWCDLNGECDKRKQTEHGTEEVQLKRRLKWANLSLKMTAEICFVERAKSRISEEMMKENAPLQVEKNVEKAKKRTKMPV